MRLWRSPGIIGGVERKAHYLVLDLPHSDGCFVKAYPAETTEAFLDGHVSAFAFLGGVPQSILYDNTKLAVARILGDGRRQRTRSFTELQSHYRFEDRFGRPGKGNDQGKVEGMVGYVRRNFLVPVPSFQSFDALNAHLEQRCLERMDSVLRGHDETIGQRMERDLEARLPLPAVPYDACDKHASRVSSRSLVRYKTNDYSAPVAYGHRDVLVRGYVNQVVISCGAAVIARHPRSYERDDFVFDPIHYLPRLEQKTAALDQAAPLQGWQLPEEFATLRRLPESRMGRRGKREFVQVLRLLESFSHQEVHHAVQDALRLGAISFDAVKHLLLCHLEGRPPRLDLDLYPYLPRVSVKTTSATDYLALLPGRAAGVTGQRCSWSITSRNYGCPPSRGSTASWPPSAPPRMWTTLTTCCVSPNWNSLTDTSAWCSAAFGPRASPPSKAWTPSTSWPSPR